MFHVSGKEAIPFSAVRRQYIDESFGVLSACLQKKVRRNLAWWRWVADVRKVLDGLREGAEKY